MSARSWAQIPPSMLTSKGSLSHAAISEALPRVARDDALDARKRILARAAPDLQPDMCVPRRRVVKLEQFDHIGRCGGQREPGRNATLRRCRVDGHDPLAGGGSGGDIVTRPGTGDRDGGAGGRGQDADDARGGNISGKSYFGFSNRAEAWRTPPRFRLIGTAADIGRHKSVSTRRTNLRASGIERGEVSREVEEVEDTERFGKVGGRVGGQEKTKVCGEVRSVERAVGRNQIRRARDRRSQA